MTYHYTERKRGKSSIQHITELAKSETRAPFQQIAGVILWRHQDFVIISHWDYQYNIILGWTSYPSVWFLQMPWGQAGAMPSTYIVLNQITNIKETMIDKGMAVGNPLVSQ